MRSIFIFSVVLTAMSLFSCGVNNASTAKKEKFTGSTGAPSWINKGVIKQLFLRKIVVLQMNLEQFRMGKR